MSPAVDIDESLVRLRIALPQEEVGEFVDAAVASGLVAMAEALADIVYVAYSPEDRGSDQRAAPAPRAPPAATAACCPR